MNLIITNLVMVDIKNRLAKKIEFSPYKNLITSARNHLGKSVIMKSIYYALGAEVYFPAPIKKIELLTIVTFTLEDHIYKIARLNKMFALFKDDVFEARYTSVGDFNKKLIDVFKFEICLVGKDEDKTITVSPPAYYYLPYYIDQENGWSSNSTSFAHLQQFDLTQRKESYFYHLGSLDSIYVEINRKLKRNDKRKIELKREVEKLETVVDTLKAGVDSTLMSFDVETLERAIEERKSYLHQVLKELEKSRTDLLNAEDERVVLIHEKELLGHYLNANKKLPALESEIIDCPHCGFSFSYDITARLQKIYLAETLNEDYAERLIEIGTLDRKIEKFEKKFNAQQHLLDMHEASLKQEQSVYNLYLRSKTTNELIKDYTDRISRNLIEIRQISGEIKDLSDKLHLYKDKKIKDIESYGNHLSKIFAGLDVPLDQVEDYSEPGSYLSASGAYGPRCKVAQILAFIKTKQDSYPDLVNFPIVIDSPNALEQDPEHLETVIRLLLTWEQSSNQVIIASIEGRFAAKEINGVRIIELTNPPNQLMSPEEYCSIENELKQVLSNL